MSNLTPGNWIAFQNEQTASVNYWSIGIENRHGMHGISDVDGDDSSMVVGGFCTEADAKAMAASKELLELAHQYASDLRHPPTADSLERRLERIAAVLAKAGAA